MRLIKKISLLATVALVAIACEKDIINDTDTRDQYLGTWDVLETEGWSAPQNYSVEITAGAEADDIVIKGIYHIDQLSVEGYVAGYYLTIPEQSMLGFTIAGSGQTNRDFDQITIDFTVDDGGSTDQVKAVLTR